jgi:hypothetical protein
MSALVRSYEPQIIVNFKAIVSSQANSETRTICPCTVWFLTADARANIQKETMPFNAAGHPVLDFFTPLFSH